MLWVGNVDDGRTVRSPNAGPLRPGVSSSELSGCFHGLTRAAKIEQTYRLIRADSFKRKPFPVQRFAEVVDLVSRPIGNLGWRSFDTPGVGIQRNRRDVAIICA